MSTLLLFFCCVGLTTGFLRHVDVHVPYSSKVSNLQYELKSKQQQPFAVRKVSSTFSSYMDSLEKKNPKKVEVGEEGGEGGTEGGGEGEEKGKKEDVEGKEVDSFKWSKQWYPIAIEGEMDPSLPRLVHLLGKRFVLWRDDSAQGEWKLIDEACPHRLASLAIGRVDKDKGTIMCRYHGWEFNGDGECTTMPMATTNSSINNPRSCSKTYPVQTKQGLIWAWPDGDGDRFLVSMLSPLPMLPEMNDVANSGYTAWSRKEWPIDWVSMVENNFDPAHAMFLHDNTFSFDSKNAKAMESYKVTSVSPWEAINNPNISNDIAAGTAGIYGETLSKGGGPKLPIDGIVVSHKGYNKANTDMNATRAFVFPSTSIVRYDLNQAFLFYFVPTRPGYTQVLGALRFPLPPAIEAIIAKSKKVRSFMERFHPALKHMFLASDHIMFIGLEPQDISGMRPTTLEMDEREALASASVPGSNEGGNGKKGSGSGVWKKAYFMPTQSDVGVVAVRRWLDKWSSNGIVGWLNPSSYETVGSASPVRKTPRLSLMQLNDRWEAHGKDCMHCRRSVEVSARWVAKLEKVSLISATLAILSTTFSLPAKIKSLLPFTIPRSIPTIALTIIALLSHLLAGKFKDFSHSLQSAVPRGAPPHLKINYKDYDKMYSTLS